MWTKTAVLVLAANLLAQTTAALAALGGDAASIDVDRAHMKAQRRIVAARKYSVQEMQLPSGTTIREYLSPAGKVFAVAWQGPHMPDLRQLFGDHFEAYRDAAQGGRKARGPLRVEQPGLVVHSGGHMRGFAGRAYVPQLVPADVSIDEIK
ncbi:MAG TPA: DUF2844 domain-containing protein [Rhodocyclaceae bacterium]|nr:DUF2844 domain-containing protein [Rhodocyclaceae bacterium]